MMESRSAAAKGGATPARWRVWPLVPILLLLGTVSAFGATGGSVFGLLGRNPPPADEFDIRRIELKPGEVRIRVMNPQRDELTIASVTVDDAIVPFQVEGSETLGRLRAATIVVPYDWVADEPLSVGVTSSTGIETTKEVAAAFRTPEASPRGFLGYGVIGFVVGVVPVALGLLWLPSLRQAPRRWLAAFMALTGGLLAFLALEALAEALERQAALPGAVGGPGLVLIGVAATYLALTFLAQRLGTAGGDARAGLGGLALATFVAIGIGLHNLGEGLAIGSSFAFGELTLGTLLVVGFMIHNITEGLGIAAPAAEEQRVGLGRLAALALVAGSPAVFGAWIGGFVTNDVLGVVFFAAAAGAALEVIVEVGRYVARRAPEGLASGHVAGGFLAGLALMYATGLLVG